MTALWLLRRQSPAYYQLAGFWSPQVRWREMTRHCNSDEYNRRLRIVNPIPFRMLVREKMVEKALWHLAGMPMVRFLGYVHPHAGFTFDGHALRNLEEIRHFLDRFGEGEICIKMSRGSHGISNRILSLRHDKEIFDRSSECRIDIDDVFQVFDKKNPTSFIMEEIIHQHEAMRALNESSVNTLRIWAIHDGKETRSVAAMLKVGRRGSIVDNSSSGGLVAPVDIATGRIGNLCGLSPERPAWPVHPDHGAAVEGRHVPCFEEAKALAATALARLPKFGYVGADIAITPQGPLIVECNHKPLYLHGAFMGRPTMDLLGDARAKTSPPRRGPDKTGGARRGLPGKLADIWRMAGARANEKSRLRQMAEMALLLAMTGNGPGYYQLGAFWKRDMRMAEMLQHLGARDFRHCLERLAPAKFANFSRHKLVEKAILSLANVPTAPFLGLADRLGGFVRGGAPLRDAAEFRSFVETLGPRKFCHKVLEGWGGFGVGIKEIEPCGRIFDPRDGRRLSPEDLFEELRIADGNSVMFEDFIEQHPSLAEFNPSSVNSMRMWVLETDGVATVHSAMLRIGRKGSVVDNIALGGLAANVDLDTGRVGTLHERAPERRYHPVHPDHGVAVEGRVLPFFEDAKTLAALALLRMPDLHFAGVDVAVAKDGPLIIEMNVRPDREHAAFNGIATRRLFAGTLRRARPEVSGIA